MTNSNHPRFAQALALLDGNETLLRELGRLYLEDYPAQLEALDAALAAGDEPGVVRAAHNLRGLAATFGDTALFQPALAVEEGAATGELAELGDEIAAIHEASAALAADLRGLSAQD